MDNSNGRKVCSFCGEDIASDFKRCPYCGSLLEVKASYSDADKEDMVNMVSNKDKEDNGSDSSSFKFDKSINDTESLTEFTGNTDFTEQDVPYGVLETDQNETVGSDEGLESKTLDLPERNSFSTSEPVQNPTVRDNSSVLQQSRNIDRDNRYKENQQKPQSQKPSLSNGMKVFLVSMSNLLPGIGQLAGVIFAIVFMNAEEDKDKKSFGVSLLISSIAAFVIVSISCCILAAYLAPDY